MKRRVRNRTASAARRKEGRKQQVSGARCPAARGEAGLGVPSPPLYSTPPSYPTCRPRCRPARPTSPRSYRSRRCAGPQPLQLQRPALPLLTAPEEWGREEGLSFAASPTGGPPPASPPSPQPAQTFLLAAPPVSWCGPRMSAPRPLMLCQEGGGKRKIKLNKRNTEEKEVLQLCIWGCLFCFHVAILPCQECEGNEGVPPFLPMPL